MEFGSGSNGTSKIDDMERISGSRVAEPGPRSKMVQSADSISGLTLLFSHLALIASESITRNDGWTTSGVKGVLVPGFGSFDPK
jgi:hypothetical protein